ncbi:hypothetical protein IGB42_02963 [Andreprevotia sp. IGB-42]|nr:hypothetical protein IGB42_02963 [Andreprevotia sp. IGB-42]
MKLLFLFVTLAFASVMLIAAGSVPAETILPLAVLVFGVAASAAFIRAGVRKGQSRKRLLGYAVAGLAVTGTLAYLAAFLAFVMGFHT